MNQQETNDYLYEVVPIPAHLATDEAHMELLWIAFLDMRDLFELRENNDYYNALLIQAHVWFRANWVGDSGLNHHYFTGNEFVRANVAIVMEDMEVEG